MFYFLILRPQARRGSEHAGAARALKKGDEVMTGGGIIGRVKDIKEVEIGGSKETRVTVETRHRHGRRRARRASSGSGSAATAPGAAAG